MKKLIALLTVLTLIGSCALAEETENNENTEDSETTENCLTVDNYRYITVADDDDDVEVYAFARVTNDGKEAVRVKDGYLLVSEGNKAEDTDTFSAYAEYLNPGEHTYVRFKMEPDNADTVDAVTDVNLSVTQGETKDHITNYYTAESSYESSEETMYARVTNNTDETTYGIKTVFALMDGDGKLLYVDSCNMLSKVGLEPGSTVVMKCELPEVIDDYFKDNDIKPASVEAIAYTIEKTEDED